MRPRANSILWIVALALLAAGVSMIALAPSVLQDHRRRMERRIKDLRQLEQFKAQAGVYTSAIRAYTTLSSAEPPPVQQIVSNMFSAQQYAVEALDRAPANEEWIVERQRLRLREIPYQDMVAAVNRLGLAVPPWHTVGIEIWAGDKEGIAREIVLSLEALHRIGEE